MKRGAHLRTDRRGERAVSDDAVDVVPARTEVGVAEAHRRFGGIDVPATLAGTMAGLGTAAFLADLASAGNGIAYQRGLAGATGVSIGALVTGLVTLVLAFLVGGWVAGRMARYDGARNGLLSGVWFVVLAAAVAGAGAWFGNRYDVFGRLNLPQWFSHNATGTTAVVTGVVALVVVLAAATVGGSIGTRYHRRADALIVSTRERGLRRPGAVVRGEGRFTRDGTEAIDPVEERA